MVLPSRKWALRQLGRVLGQLLPIATYSHLVISVLSWGWG